MTIIETCLSKASQAVDVLLLKSVSKWWIETLFLIPGNQLLLGKLEITFSKHDNNDIAGSDGQIKPLPQQGEGIGIVSPDRPLPFVGKVRH